MRRMVTFERFAVELESGDRVTVESAEKIAFDPVEGGIDTVVIIANRQTHLTSLKEITHVRSLA